MVMPKKPGNHLIDPQRIRALATGIGQTQQRSRMTGAHRAEEVAEGMPPGVASKAVGYPAVDRTDEMAELRAGIYEPDGALPANGDVPC